MKKQGKTSLQAKLDVLGQLGDYARDIEYAGIKIDWSEDRDGNRVELSEDLAKSIEEVNEAIWKLAKAKAELGYQIRRETIKEADKFLNTLSV